MMMMSLISYTKGKRQRAMQVARDSAYRIHGVPTAHVICNSHMLVRVAGLQKCGAYKMAAAEMGLITHTNSSVDPSLSSDLPTNFSSLRSMATHMRSISLPTRSYALVLKAEQELQWLRALVSPSSALPSAHALCALLQVPSELPSRADAAEWRRTLRC